MTESKNLYTAKAINTGGRNGESHTPDGSFSVRVSAPKEMGGAGQGSNPEQLFALGYSACFNSALEHKLREAKVKGKTQVEADVSINPDPADNGYKLSVVLTVSIENQTLAETQKFADQAHSFCPYSKATRGNIDVKVLVVEYKEAE